MNFTKEKNRVLKNDDTFVPAPGVSVQDVHAERDRLSRLEESARRKQMELDKDKSDRREYLEKDKSATVVQAAFRASLGRQKFNLTKHLRDMTSGEWVEVRDKQSGDVWYYNTINGSSQWEKPDSLKDKISADDKVKKLPVLADTTKGGKSKNKYLSKVQQMEETSLPAISQNVASNSSPMKGGNNMSQTVQVTWDDIDAEGVGDPYEQQTIERELEEALGTKGIHTESSLLAPDGSFKPQLKQTIQAALSQSRFDSVSSVVADERWMEGGGTQKPIHTSKSGRFSVDPSRKPMTAVMTFNKRKQGAGVKIKEGAVRNDGDGEMEEEENLVPRSQTDLTLKGVDHSGFEMRDTAPAQNMCFGCWSAGVNKECALHLDLDKKQSKGQSMLLCRNWDLDVMRRRYRSEEIQELFLKKASSLRYDNKRKKFLAVVEQRHPIYRSMQHLLDKFNMRSCLIIKCVRWMKSFAEEVRMGAVKPQRTGEKARLLRLKRSVSQWGEVNRYTGAVIQLLPIAPTTGYSWPERINQVQFLFTHPDPALGEEVQLIIAPPMPVPLKLYELREHHLAVAKSIPMPRPSYSAEAFKRVILPTNKFIEEGNPADWLEHISGAITREVVLNALHQVDSVTPVAGLELMRRLKYPNPSSVKFATIGRKPSPGMLAKGGLSMELLISQLVTTYVPPQYGNFMVMDKSTISPGISPEVTITFLSYPMPPVLQVYLPRHLEHPLNYRRSPTVTINSKAALDEKFMYGTNRPEQTGERDSHGFRTTAWAKYLLTHVDTNPLAFTPGAEVVSLNVPAANHPCTTHADYSYPFCEPSTRDNTTLDFYHLLLTGTNSSPKFQVFTAIAQQDPGDFQKMSNPNLPMGHVLVSVYRSWAYTQRHKIEEFKSDDGVPYWYHRETGQTFWERPLVEEEEVSPLLGGTVVDVDHNEEPFTMHKGAPGQQRNYHQGEVRKSILAHHETEAEATKRRKNANGAAKVARQKGKLPDLMDGVSRIANPSTIGDESAVSDIPSSRGIGDKPKVPKIQVHNPLHVEKNPALPSPQNSGRSGVSTESSLISSNKKMYNKTMSGVQDTIPGDGIEGGNSMLTGSIGTNEDEFDDEMDGVKRSSSVRSESTSSQQLMMPGMDPAMIHNMTITLGQLMSKMDMRNAKPQDMIQLGLGMGLAMMQQSIAISQSEVSPQEQGVSFADDMSMFSDDRSGYGGNTKEPIGVPRSQVQSIETMMLNHEEETRQKQHHKKLDGTPLTALENALELKVQASMSATPDEDTEGKYLDLLPGNADEAVRKKVPVLVYPELASNTEGGAPPEFYSHPPAGIGTSFVLKKDARSQSHVPGTDLRRLASTLPVGFFENIEAKRVAKQTVDYLPQVPNLPQSHTIGRVKPRSAAIDWVAIGFDPWSAGKKPLAKEFITTLATKAEQLFDAAKLAEMKRGIEDGAISTVDNDGMLEQNIGISKAQKLAEDFKKVCSLCRHAKFGEVEELMNHPDWNLGMDYQDEAGNSLLHIAAQNGNKRMIKLCLRRGAELNAQNLNGQTPLHFAYAYGYNEVGDYLVNKGADDSLRNKDGLTCYEGLGSDDVDQL